MLTEILEAHTQDISQLHYYIPVGPIEQKVLQRIRALFSWLIDTSPSWGVCSDCRPLNAASVKAYEACCHPVKRMHIASGDNDEHDHVITRNHHPAGPGPADQPNRALERARVARLAGTGRRPGRDRRDLPGGRHGERPAGLSRPRPTGRCGRL